jgi:hypothetical protein
LKTQTGRGAKGKFYNVILSSDLLGVMEKDPDNKDDEKKEGDKEKEGEGGGKNSKEGIFNDLTGFFKFVVNNKKFLNTKGTLSGDALVSKKDRDNPCYGLKPGMEVSYTSKRGEKSIHVVKKLLDNGLVQIKKKDSNDAPFAIDCSKVEKITENIFNEIEKLLLEADVNPTEKVPVETKSYEGRIYINSIKLGPKAEKRRTGDAKNYAAATGGDQSFDYKQWSGLIKDIPEAGANFRVDIRSVSTLDVEQKKVFNEIKNLVSQNALVRRSKKGGPSNTSFIVDWGKNKVFVAEVENASSILKKPNISIRIGKKAGNSDEFDKPFDATIQLTPAS